MASNNIHTGLWMNYSRGRVFGATITLTNAQATALVSFIAVLITHTGSRSFKILRFCLHQFRRHEKRRDGLERQQDVLLRNAETDIGTFPQIFRLAWNWRGYTSDPFARSFGLIFLVFIHSIGFLCAGIASSFVSDGNFPAVIAKGGDCGLWVFDNGTLDTVTWWQKQSLETTTATKAYVRLCYDDDERTGGNASAVQGHQWSECRVFPQRKLEWMAAHNASCPFSGGICLEGDNAAYMMDTGLQSSRVLGINSPVELQWQHRTTCSPIKTKGYTTVDKGAGKYGENVTKFLYGPVGGLGNETYSISEYANTSGGFTLNAQSTTPWTGNGALQMTDTIPPLRRDDGDLTLLFLGASGVNYFQAVDDPIFSAHHRLQNFTVTGISSFPSYHTDNPITVLGCFEQSQFCNPRTKHCTGLAPVLAPDAHFSSVTNTLEEESVFALLRFHVMQQSIFLQTVSTGSSVLAVNDLLYSGSVQKLAREQWKTEAGHIFELGLAATQIEIVKSAKSSYPHDRGPVKNLLDDKHKGICRMIAFHETGYTSISFFWLLFIVIGSVLVTILSSCDDWVGKMMWKRWPRRVLAWRVDSAPWLLRMCSEQGGVGSWRKDARKDIPVTTVKGEALGLVEIIGDMIHIGGKEGVVDLEAWGKEVRLHDEKEVEPKGWGSRRKIPLLPSINQK